MRQPRLKAPETWEVAYYHCVSRVVERRLAFDEEDKKQFVQFMRFYERVCQVRVVTYCVMANHFHLLLEVPAKPKVMPTEVELIEHIRRCYGKRRAGLVALELKQWRARGVPQEAERIVAQWLGRMWDMSSFMKTLKQRFTQWHNKRHERKGTLWEDRYHSTIVQGRCAALAMVGGYIDLNPIRAYLVKDPKDYLWSGYGAAVGGDKRAMQGMEKLVEHAEKNPPKGKRALELYRVGLFGAASDGGHAHFSREQSAAQQSKVRGGIPQEQVEVVRRAGGKLSSWQMLRCRVRYFTAGAVIGSRNFVNEVFEARRARFGPNRSEGAHPMRGADFGGMCVLRDLRKDVLN